MGEMVKTRGIVLSQYNLAEDIFDLTLGCREVAQACRPGQFVSLYCADRSRLLPRPISICDRDTEQGTIRLVYRRTGAGTGTEIFSGLLPGDDLELLGPLGNSYPAMGDASCENELLKNAFREDEGGEVWLMGGGIGIPPMLLLAREWTPYKKVHVILGYRDTLFLNRDFERIPGVTVHIATEDGSSGVKGTVLDALPDGRPALICACGPAPMLRAVRQYALERDIRCLLSLEQRMACGVGACLACVCQSAGKDAHSQVHNKRVCAEGPVFDAREIIL